MKFLEVTRTCSSPDSISQFAAARMAHWKWLVWNGTNLLGSINNLALASCMCWSPMFKYCWNFFSNRSNDSFVTVCWLTFGAGSIGWVHRILGTVTDYREGTSSYPTRVTSIVLLNVIRAHQKPISHLEASSLVAVSASYDHTLKVFDLRTCQLQSMLHAHSGPVTAVCIDHASSTLFSGCEQGIICWWNLTTGELLRSLDVKCLGVDSLR
ncbi:WD domain, G-beta repeat protein [Cooperia oncophora]